MQSDSKQKKYYCPHCEKMVMKGKVKRLSMTCPHCGELIRDDEKNLIKTNEI